MTATVDSCGRIGNLQDVVLKGRRTICPPRGEVLELLLPTGTVILGTGGRVATLGCWF